jgi:hypothetical protein
MQCQIDLKSLLAGVLLAMCVFMAFGASQSSSSPHFGRYQLVPADREARTYVIDSRAGRIWSRRSGNNYFIELDTGAIASAEDKKQHANPEGS